MSDLKLLASLRKFKSNLSVEDYLKGENRQNLKAIEDGFRRTNKAMTSANSDIASLRSDLDSLESTSSSVNYTVSSIIGSFAPGTDTQQDVTNLTGSITTTGGAVEISLRSGGSGGLFVSMISTNHATNVTGIYIVKDSANLAIYGLKGANVSHPSAGISYTDFATVGAAATYAYKIQVANGSSGGCTFYNCVLTLREVF